MTSNLMEHRANGGAGPLRAIAATFAMLILFVGCGFQSEKPSPSRPAGGTTTDLDAEIARASELGRPMLVLVTTSGKSDADDSARRLLDRSTLKSDADRIVPVVLDLSVSRNRATAARFHALKTPALFCLTPRGVIASRDEAPITADMVQKRIEEVEALAAGIDAKLGTLEEAVTKDSTDGKAELALADFLQEHKNMREAIPHLTSVARSDSADASERVRARVDLALAHLWIGEPEKGRHEAQALMAEWGSKFPEALAGGNLVLATQDARAKRTARARREFEGAIAVAPDSEYAQKAKDGLAALPAEEK